MNLDQAAQRCAELGNKTRLSIFRLLVKAGRDGLPVGSIQKNLDVPASTLTHHIQRLVRVGLVTQERDSRTLYCQPQIEAIQELTDFLLAECCSLQQNIHELK